MLGFTRSPSCRNTRSVAIATGIVLVAVVVPGCVALQDQAPVPSDSSSPEKTSVSSPIAHEVAPPTSEADALEAASSAINADEAAIFGVLVGELPIDVLEGFEADPYLEQNIETLSAFGEDDSTFSGIDGQPNLWLPAPNGSTAETLELGDASHPFGIVRMTGCLQSLWWTVHVPEVPVQGIGDYYPYRVTVQYEPDRRLWLVASEDDLSNSSGAPECPAT